MKNEEQIHHLSLHLFLPKCHKDHLLISYIYHQFRTPTAQPTSPLHLPKMSKSSKPIEYALTCVAIFLSAFWFFALPPLIRPYWEGLWSGYSPLAKQVILNQINVVYFVIFSLGMLPIYRGNYPFFEQYKISDKPWAWKSDKQKERDAFWKLSKKSLRLYAVNAFLLVPALTAGKFFLLGDNMSFSASDEEWPR